MKKSLIAAGCVLGLACGATAATALYVADDDDVKLGMGEDRLPSTTAADWVTYADHVLVVTPTSERTIEPTDTASDTSTSGLINREVTFQVNDVVWSNPEADHKAPSEMSWVAWGWSYSDGNTGDRTEFAVEGSPRLEVGHTYVVAVSWEEARCAEGDPVEPAQWAPLGTGAVLPYDKGVIGQGEFEGTDQPLAEARSAAADSGFPTLGQQLVGESSTEFAEELTTATPVKEQTFTPPAPC